MWLLVRAAASVGPLCLGAGCRAKKPDQKTTTGVTARTVGPMPSELAVPQLLGLSPCGVLLVPTGSSLSASLRSSLSRRSSRSPHTEVGRVQRARLNSDGKRDIAARVIGCGDRDLAFSRIPYSALRSERVLRSIDPLPSVRRLSGGEDGLKRPEQDVQVSRE